MSVPFLRLKVAQLQSFQDELLTELKEAIQQGREALAARDAYEEESRRVAVEFEALGVDLERYELALQALHRESLQWRSLFLRTLALALHQHSLAVRRKDACKGLAYRVDYYRELWWQEEGKRCALDISRVVLSGGIRRALATGNIPADSRAKRILEEALAAEERELSTARERQAKARGRRS